MEITRKWTDRLENTFSKSLNTFLASEFHIQLDSYSWSLENVFEKVINKKTYNFSIK